MTDESTPENNPPPSYTPPTAIEAESCLLSCMIHFPEELERWSQDMDEKDFYRPPHRALFLFLQDMAKQNRPVDMATLLPELQNSGKIDELGGYQYVLSVFVYDAYQKNASEYARLIRSAARRRRQSETALTLLQAAKDGASDDEMEALAEQLVTNAPHLQSEHSVSARDILFSLTGKIEERSENPAALLGLASGLDGVDRHLNGLQRPDLFVLGARPGVGKSGLLGTIAAHVARRGEPVLLFSMEMSGEQLMMRMVCSEARLNSHRLRSGRLEPDEYDRYFQAVHPLYSAPLVINDRSGTTPAYMRAEIRKFIRRYGRIALVGVDYVQLMRPDRPAGNRFQELTEVSIELKSIARDFSVPMIALAQLSRAVESRDNKRPVLSDLRETGQLEQDADIVGFLYREDMYAPPREAQGPEKKPVELLIRKHRNGPLGTVMLDFVDEFTLFLDHEDDGF